ncbi:MAG: hypothetical protein PHY16_19170 [Methylobacter sp.]|nr:hypothetical protein [Methylobacter sp.]
MHNIGAAAVVGSPAVAWWLVLANQVPAELLDRPTATALVQRRLAWFTLLAWSTQVASGIGFGVTTYYLKHELPELTGVGLAALGIKVTCALVCLALATLYLRASSRWPAHRQLRVWQILFVLGLTALISAAFLRWYG